MATREDLQTRLNTLRTLRAKGVRKITEGGNQVEYRSDAELATAIADLERQLAGMNRSRVSTVRLIHSKGT
jgi:hypothetical protein